jgi:hypothetical protein
MEFKPGNKVLKLCTEGMNAETVGQKDTAEQLFKEAWDNAENDFEKFASAHYMARIQKDPNDMLHWNLKALTYANLIQDESMKTHYPSLYLNVGKSYETVSDMNNANKHYKLAAQFSGHLPAGGYGDLIKSGISAGLKRTGAIDFSNAILDELINMWCDRKELKALSLVLPAYLGNLGTDNDTNKLISALSYLSATRMLNPDEQLKIDKIITELSLK